MTFVGAQILESHSNICDLLTRIYCYYQWITFWCSILYRLLNPDFMIITLRLLLLIVYNNYDYDSYINITLSENAYTLFSLTTKALSNSTLYNQICNHVRKLRPVRNV